MTEIRPFRALRFPSNIGRPEELLAPPYDVISEEYRQALLGRSPRNVARVILKDPKDAERGYERIGETFAAWRGDGTLVQDPRPALYLLDQAFSWEGRDFVRTGILARFRVEPEGSPLIRPHEKTRGPAKEDRFSVLKATRANFSPIFFFFEDAERFGKAAAQARANTPVLATYTDDDGTAHTLRAIEQPEDVAALAAAAGTGPSYIADGHHRYATAQRYLREVGPEGAFTYGYFCPSDAGLLALPYHRILFDAPDAGTVRTRLAGRYAVSEAADMDDAAAKVARSKAAYAFAVCWPAGEALVCESAPGLTSELPADAAPSLKALDTYFLHEAAFRHMGLVDPRVEFVHSLADARAELRSQPNVVAVLTRAVPLGQIRAVADASESMPPKSTFFHPKIPSGIVIHPLEVEA